MKSNLKLSIPTKPEWLNAVFEDFDSFLQDHADCERKASSMAMSIVAKYPQKIEIISDLINIAMEQLQHFKDVYTIMESREVPLNQEISADPYVNIFLRYCRTGRIERFLDRMIAASIVATRDAERFRMIAENLENRKLMDFYTKIYHSKASIGKKYLEMLQLYFDEEAISLRRTELSKIEGEVISALEIRAALH